MDAPPLPVPRIPSVPKNLRVIALAARDKRDYPWFVVIRAASSN